MVTYIKKENSILIFLMDPPTNLEALCAACKVPLEKLSISCVFCNCTLKPQDLFAFSIKKLQLIVKKKFFFACCSFCLECSAKFERINHYQCSSDALFLQHLTGKNLFGLTVRCMFCLKLLDSIEKLAYSEKGYKFHLIRGWWRGCCRFCSEIE